MTRDEILQVMDANSARLCALGVVELALFGSHARGEATSQSDVDFLVELSDKSFDRYMDLKDFLQELLGRKVDLVLKSAIKPRLRERILSEAVRAA
jgi:predicted nucleotidyltransferase